MTADTDPSPGTELVPTEPAPVVEHETADPPTRVDPPAQKGTVLDAVARRIEAERRPIVPTWVRDRDGRRTTVTWAAAYVVHETGFHGARLPRYALLLAAYAPRGAYRVGRRIVDVLLDAEGRPLRQHEVAKQDSDRYLKLIRERNRKVARRSAIAGAAALLALMGAWLASAWLSGAFLLLAAVGAVVAFGLVGQPRDRRVVTPATVSPSAPPKLTSDVVDRALRACGVSELRKADQVIAYVSPITRDGPGWRAEGDLPHGVTALDVMEHRSGLSSGLRRPSGCVWPEPVPDQHDGRLVLWVGDRDMAKAKQAPWPLVKAAKRGFSLFDPVPFGTDQRGRNVPVTLMYSNLLVGAMPGAGKTFSLKPPLLAAALDPLAEIDVYELKGTGDLGFAEKVASRYRSGPDDASIEECIRGLRDVYADLERRAKAIGNLPRDLCPENKVTPDLARKRSLGLHPRVIGIDECQELFSHEEHGAEAGKLCTAIIKRGRALGVILILATQRPDAKSLPTGVSSNVGLRFCLKVMDQQANDMVLGTSMHKNGIRANTLTAKDKGIGYLVGASDEATVARGYFLDGPAADAIAEQARKLRETAGTLSGYCVGQVPDADESAAFDLLADLRVVMAKAEQPRMWSEHIVAALADLRPGAYGGWDSDTLARALPAGLDTRQIAAEDEHGHRRNRRGLALDDVLNAITRRDGDTE